MGYDDDPGVSAASLRLFSLALFAVVSVGAGWGYWKLSERMDLLEVEATGPSQSVLSVEEETAASEQSSGQVEVLKSTVEGLQKQVELEMQEVNNVLTGLNEAIKKVEFSSTVGSEASLAGEAQLKKKISDLQTQQVLLQETVTLLRRESEGWQKSLEKHAAELSRIKKQYTTSQAPASPPKKSEPKSRN